MSTPPSGGSGFVGVWKLASLRELGEDGALGDSAAFGPLPAGSIVYTDSGYVSVSFMNSRRLSWTSETEPTATCRETRAR